MAITPFAEFRPVNRSRRRMSGHLGLALHVQQGNGSPYGWFTNPASGADSTWWVAKRGKLEQYVDTDLQAWAQVAGNAQYLSVETEGYVGEPLTAAQILTLGKLYVWCVQTFGFPLALANKPGERGLGYHAMGGIAWGGHPCPGPIRASSRPLILATASKLLKPEVPMPEGTVHYDPPLQPRIISSWVPPEGGVLLLGEDGSVWAFGGARNRGGVNGKPYFAGRTAHHIEASKLPGKVYAIVATSGEAYDDPDE